MPPKKRIKSMPKAQVKKKPSLLQRIKGWRQRRWVEKMRKIKQTAEKKAAVTAQESMVKAAEPTKPAGTDSDAGLKKEQRMNKMAAKAANQSTFVEACKRKGLDPKETFKRYSPELMKDQNVAKQMMDIEGKVTEMQLEGKKVRFSPTNFYAKKIIEKYLQ